MKSQASRVRRRMPRLRLPMTTATGPLKSAGVEGLISITGQPGQPDAGLPEQHRLRARLVLATAPDPPHPPMRVEPLA